MRGNPQTNYMHGMSEYFSFAEEEAWFAENPSRIFRVHEMQSEHGHLAYPGGPQRPEVKGLDINAWLFVTARVADRNAPQGFSVLVHAVSLPALSMVGYETLGDAPETANLDYLALAMLEAEWQLGNTSALNMLRLVSVPALASGYLSTLWHEWLLRFKG